MSGEPTVVSLFAGCGGSSLGYKWAGFRELLAIDWDRNAEETFRLNFPNIPFWNRDILGVTAKEILDFCGIKKGELDVLDASPPCQGFSTAGKRQVNDRRNDLFKEVVRLIDSLQPRVFIIENVSGLMKGRMKGYFREIMGMLKKLPYLVKCKLMNAKYYKVPQSRKRLIWVGVRKDLKKEPCFPLPSHSLISIKDAIKEEGFIEYRHSYSKGECSFKKSPFNRPCLTVTASGLGWKVYYDTKGQFGRREINLNRQLPTVTKNNRHHLKISTQKETAELFSIEEILLLSSYPKHFKLTGSFSDKWARIGNSVPPKFMRAIAEAVRGRILCA